MKINSGFPINKSPEAKLKEQDGQLRDAAKMYETHFLNQMVKSMRSTVQRDDSLIKTNFAEKIFSEQLDNQYVDGWANKGGVGLADLIYQQISEKYLATAKKDFGRAPGALPIAPKPEPHGLKSTDTIKMKTLPGGAGAHFRFEVQDPSGAGFEALAPMSGVAVETQNLGQGWQLVRMDHGQGLGSELTFPGSLTDLSPGTAVQTGQKLGTLDSARPVLAWKLDWS